MGHKCFVPYCRSGYASCSEIVSLFSPPKDPELLKIWIKNIARTDKILNRKNRVCAKHFDPKYIVREWKNDLINIPLDLPRLSKDAVPTIFPGCPSSLNIKKKLKRKRLVRDTKATRKHRKTKIESSIVHSASESSECDLQNDNLNSNNVDNKALIFEELWKNNCSSVKLPNELWGIHKVHRDDGSRCLSFSKMYFRKDTNLPNIERQVILDINFEPQIVVVGFEIHELCTKMFENDICVNSLEDIILQVENLNVCSKCLHGDILSAA